MTRSTSARASSLDETYGELYRRFQWNVPEKFNIARECCVRWAADAKRVAIVDDGPGRKPKAHTYARLQSEANRLSNALRALGVTAGDRVAIVMPQRFETAVAYMGVMQLGAVAVPLSMLFGPEALEYRLHDSEAVIAICDVGSAHAVLQVRDKCPTLRRVIGVDAGEHADIDMTETLRVQSPKFECVDTYADDGALIIYTSGTTGPPKGALLPHRALLGNLTGFVCSQNWFGFDGKTNRHSDAVFWSPADWAWTGGLMDALLPTLYFGRPIVAWNGRFGAETAFELLQRHGVTHTFLFPTALKAMMKACPTPRQQYRLQLQALMSGGEAVGDAVFNWCREQLGVTVNEIFGQTEMNYVVGNCSAIWPPRPGSMGKPYPGHRVELIDADGQLCKTGDVGEVAVHRRDMYGHLDPVFFLGYWKNDTATRNKYAGEWCRTGDLAQRDADGYLWYQGRADDVFKAAGYRIGPGEIENCLVKHPSVANAAVVPKPDRERGAVVKAYVVLSPAALGERSLTRGGPVGVREFDAALIAQLQNHVRDKLAPYEYPKEIEFIDQLPMTTTGKVQRRVLRLQEEERARKLGVLIP